MAAGAFYRHLADAVVLNRARRGYYAGRTGGRSAWLSRLLVSTEVCCLPFAAAFDKAAERFNRRGIALVRDDVMPMEAVPPMETPPRYTRQASAAELSEVKRAIAVLDRTIGRALTAPAFEDVASACLEALDRVEAFEAQHQAHYAMALHLVESIGLGAAHALTYREQSGGETDVLARRFLRFQALGLPSLVLYDRMAQASHALGAGIVVNDVPSIPFRSLRPSEQVGTGQNRK